jgi:hypothetical protein
VRFVDFLKTTVLLNAAAATALAAVAVIGAGNRGETEPAVISIAVWLLAALLGQRLGRRAETNPPIARLLAGAKATTTMPEHRPAAVLANRLWPLVVYTVASGALAFLAPQIPGIAAGLPIVLALSWRRQDAAVAAIEERDGAQFFVKRTSPLRPIALERTPGFKAVRPQQLANGASR